MGLLTRRHSEESRSERVAAHLEIHADALLKAAEDLQELVRELREKEEQDDEQA